MKNKNFKLTKIHLLVLFLALALGCERDLSDDAVLATFPKVGDIFTDNFVGMGSDFYLPYSDGFAKPDIFEVDTDVKYQGTASLRIDVPNATDPDGSYVGALFRVDGSGRDLSGFDALTFWVKSTTAPLIEKFGFGQSEYTTYQTSISNIQLSTTWKKIIIPIPDASKLINEKGMFWLVATPDNGDGYSFWIDQLKFERLGTLGQPRPAILGGQNQTSQANIDTSFSLGGLSQTFNLANGQDITVSTTPEYFDFQTSNPFVASVNSQGLVTVEGPGEVDPNTGLIDNTALITASIAGVEAAGSLTVEAVNISVISVFSDTYANVAVDNYNGFYEPHQTTLGGAVDEDGNNIINYTMLNFVAIEFYGRAGSAVPPIDATQMTHLHIDIRVNETVNPSDYINMSLHNNFTQSTAVSGVFSITGNTLLSNQWVQLDIPLTSFNGLTVKDAIGMMLFVSDGTISNVSLDNIYFYSEN